MSFQALDLLSDSEYLHTDTAMYPQSESEPSLENTSDSYRSDAYSGSMESSLGLRRGYGELRDDALAASLFRRGHYSTTTVSARWLRLLLPALARATAFHLSLSLRAILRVDLGAWRKPGIYFAVMLTASCSPNFRLGFARS